MNRSPHPNDALAARDLAHVWHPCTQMQDHEHIPLVPVVAGKGVWLFDAEKRRYMDCVSSWWVNLFGHANPRIAAALADQAQHPRARDLRRLHAPAGGRAGRAAGGDHAQGPGAGVLRRQRFGRGRDRVEDELPLLAQHRPGRAHPLHRAGGQLPRRDPGRAVGQRRGAVPRNLRAAAAGADPGAIAGYLAMPSRARRRPSSPRAAWPTCARCWNATPPRPAR